MVLLWNTVASIDKLFSFDKSSKVSSYNDALRESANCGEEAVSWLPAYWDSADAAPRTDWEDWWDIFTVAVNANY